MKTLKITVTFLLLSMLPLFASSQVGMGKIEDIMKIQTRKLIIIREEPREKVINKLTKKGKTDKIAEYKTAVDVYNTNMTEVIDKFWPYKDKGYDYKTFDEVKALKKAGKKDYAVIYCLSQTPSGMNAGYLSANGINWSWNMKANTDDVDYRDHFTSMVFNTIENFGTSTVYVTQLPDVYPTKASLIFGITGALYYFDYRMKNKKEDVKKSAKNMMDQQVEENAPKLAWMNLLIREDLLDKDLPKTSIGKYYPYRYTLCDKETIDNAIMNQQDSIAYIVVLPFVMSMSTHNSVAYCEYIFNAKDNKLMAYIVPGMGGMMGAAYGAPKVGNNKISKSTLQDFTKIIKKED